MVGSREGGRASSIPAERCRQAGRPGRNASFLQLMHAERSAVVWQQPRKQGSHFKYCFRQKVVQCSLKNCHASCICGHSFKKCTFFAEQVNSDGREGIFLEVLAEHRQGLDSA